MGYREVALDYELVAGENRRSTPKAPLKLHLTTSELWFGQEQEGILPNCSLVVVLCSFL